MASKRNAVKTPAASKENKAPPTKKAKVMEEVAKEIKAPPKKKAKVVEEVDRFQEALDATLALLADGEVATESERNALRVAAPFALRVGENDRHPYQAQLATMVSNLLQRVEQVKKHAIEREEARATQIESEKSVNSSTLTDLAAKEKERYQAKETANANLSAAREGLVLVKKAHATARETMSGLEAEHEQTTSEKAQMESFVTETWTQLKECSIPGNQWRLKNKHIERIVEIMNKSGTEASCTLALPVSLKDKPEQRGLIATKCIEHVDDQLNRFVKELSEKVEGHSDNVTEKMKMTQEALEHVTKAEGERDERENDAVAAENALLEASEEHKAMIRNGKQLDGHAKAVDSKLAAFKDNYTTVRSVMARFEVIVERGEAGAVDTEVAQEDQEDHQVEQPPPMQAQVEERMLVC